MANRDNRVPAPDRGAIAWVARGVALVLGVVAGAAAGHGLAWHTAAALPGDDQARFLAAEFVPDAAGTVSRTRAGWSREPVGGSGFLFGYRGHEPGEVRVGFPADSWPSRQPYAQVEAVAEELRRQGWQQVTLDPDYPVIRTHRAGLAVSYGPVLGDPSPLPEDPTVPVADQPVLGSEVVIRAGAPGRAPLWLAVGAVIGAGLAAGPVMAGQRALRVRPARVRRAGALLFGLGAGGLGPATLAALGLIYLVATDDLVPEPLWHAYSIPATRLPALFGGACLTAALVLALGSRRVGPS